MKYRGTSLIRRRAPLGPYNRTCLGLYCGPGGGAVSYGRGVRYPCTVLRFSLAQRATKGFVNRFWGPLELPYVPTEMCSGSEAGSCLRLIDSCTTQLKAQGPSTCNEIKEEEEEEKGWPTVSSYGLFA